MRFTDKIALVTGAGSGIGKCIALSLAREGADVVVNDLNVELAEGVAEEIVSLGRRSMARGADVSVEKEVISMVDRAVEEFGRIDLLVNSAGILDQAAPAMKQRTDDWQRVIDVHLRGCYLCCQNVAKYMVKQKSGKIVNISSIAGVVGLPMRNAYSTAKAGVIMFTRVLAVECAHYNINVNAVSPGYIRTPMVERLILGGKFDESDIIRRTPVGRVGLPEEVAGAVLFLLSDTASYITGINLPVDGGWTAFGSYGDAYRLPSPGKE